MISLLLVKDKIEMLYTLVAVANYMYGYRGRLGLIVPSSNTTNEPEFWRGSPEGVSVYSTRMILENVNEEELIGMAGDVKAAVERLSTAQVDVIAFGCTTGSLVKGVGYDEKIQNMIEDTAGVPGIATSTAIMHAFDALDAESLAIATPYIEEMNAKEVEFLKSNGYSVSQISGLGIEPNIDIGRQESSTAYRLAKSVDRPDADVVFLSCTNFRSLDIIEQLEADLKKPVISSNSATLWAALQLLEIDTSDIDLGELYQKDLRRRGYE